MAIGKVKKIQIIGHRSEQNEIAGFLQEAGAVQLVKPVISEEEYPEISAGEEEEIGKKISVLEQAINYLEKIGEKKGLLAGLIKSRILLDAGQLRGILGADHEKTQSDVRALQEELSGLDQREKHLVGELKLVLPWLKLNAALADLAAGSGSAEVIPGMLPLKNMDALRACLEKEFGERYSLENVSVEKDAAYVLLVLLKEDYQRFKPAETGFIRIELPRVPGTPSQAAEDTMKELAEISKQKLAAREGATALLKEKANLMALYDHLVNQKNKEGAKKEFFNFPHAFVLEGWIRAADLGKLQAQLRDKFSEIEITEVEPGKDEQPPVALENPEGLKPFEMLTRMYGMPGSKDMDPTPLITPFFVLYFGLCITDAAYGVVIMLLAYFFIRRSKTKPSSLLYILFWGGLLTIFGGAITGSWFGDAIDKFRIFSVFGGLKKFMIFDPMVNPIIFLGLALVLGFTQICFGLCVKIYKLARNKMVIDAICDPFCLLMMMMGIPMLVASFMKILPPIYLSVSAAMLIFGVLTTFFYVFVNTKETFFIRFFLSAYSIYSAVTGCFLGDTLSFSRLVALGMATSGIALAVNVIAQFAAGIPVVGIVLAIIVLVGGHAFNIVLQAFGAFVHYMRLQYVQFFPKFYDSGGREFKPFAKEYKYTALSEPDKIVKSMQERVGYFQKT